MGVDRMFEEEDRRREEAYQRRIAPLKARADEFRSALITAIHTLQSYAFGNQSPELAKEVVEKLKEILEHSPIEEES